MSPQHVDIKQASTEELENFRRQIPGAFKHDPEPLILTAGENQEGIAWMSRNEIDFDPDDRLLQIIVQPPHRRKSLGTRLFHAIREEAAARKIKRLIHAAGVHLTQSSTPPPEARFIASLGGTPARELETFQITRPDADKLLPRLESLAKRLPNSFHWTPASSLEPDAYSTFIKENINAVLASAQPYLPEKHPVFDELAIAALEKPDGPIAGLIFPVPSLELAATLEYRIFAVAPAHRGSALAATLLARSIGRALEGPWNQSRFYVFKDPASAMWRFAKQNARLKGTLVNFALTP